MTLNKTRLDQLLLERKITESRHKAQALIIAGKVTVNGKTILKPATKVAPTAQIVLKETEKYISRGG
ncbi:MAG: S4 domain-containing protein, partial [Elusimicrobiota bacterium]|nr:S4 domain-containing protein [Elusimicrobiota bacterium]